MDPMGIEMLRGKIWQTLTPQAICGEIPKLLTVLIYFTGFVLDTCARVD